MPTKENGNGKQQEYDASTGRYSSGGGLLNTAKQLGIQIPNRDLTQSDISRIKGEVEKRSKNIVELDSDNELARLIASSDDKKYKVIRDYLIANFGGEELELPDGKTAVIDKSDAKELAHKADSKRTAELAVLKDIISKSEYFGGTNNVEHNKFEAFRYYLTRTKYNNEIHEIWLNVGKAKYANDEWHLYAITKKETLPTD